MWLVGFYCSLYRPIHLRLISDFAWPLLHVLQTGELLSFSQPSVSSQEACVPTYGCSQGGDPDQPSSFTRLQPTSSLLGVTWAPMKRAGDTLPGGPSRDFLLHSAGPWVCQVPRVCKLENFLSKQGLRPPWQAPQSCLALAVLRVCKRLFVQGPQ